MTEIKAKLVEIYQLGSETAGVLDMPAKHWPEPGQYLPCQNLSETPSILTTNLFKVIGDKDRLSVGPLPPHWHPGDWLTLHPPQGNGFKVPASARRIGLMAYNVSPKRILALLTAARAQTAAISLYANTTLPTQLLNRIPSNVEIGPISSFLENMDWHDYLAIDVTLKEIDQLAVLIDGQVLPCEGQVLIRSAMPCHGIGKCGVCAIKSQKGWRLTCVDGPVFSFKEIFHVAR